jgi:LPXTG-motif cell wall-anchored protein
MSDKSTSSSTSSKTSASKCVDRGTAYRLTGTNEEKIKGLVGHQLEIQGRFKHADDVTASSATSGEKEKLPAEVEIVSFREAPGRDAVNEPAASTAPASSTTEPAAKAQTTPRTPPASPTMEPARPQTDTPPANPKPEKGELPRTASSTPLLALIGVLALCSGFILTVVRRRRAV